MELEFYQKPDITLTMSLSKPFTIHSSTHTYITVMRFRAVHMQHISTPDQIAKTSYESYNWIP